jgi:hypothetical protein
MQTKNLFRARIQIGDYSPLRSYQSNCPKCIETFNILWPVEILSIPLHRNVSLKCPQCKHVYLTFAALLVVGENVRLRSGEAYIP